MIPVLFKANSTNFNTNGVGRLTPIFCVVTEERNSVFELDMTVKIGCKHFEDVKQSAIVLAKPSPGRKPQPFRIYYVSRPINGKVKVKAEHLSYQLNYVPVMPFSTVNGVQNALNGFKANAAESCPFTFWTDIEKQKTASIIGDSIDTFEQEGYMIPGYRTYYPALGVTSVDQTWWMQVINTKGLTLDVNASWSGSCATNIRASIGYPSFYDRVGVVGNPDIIFVTLGTNDSSLNAPLGEYDYQTQYQNLSEDTFRTAYIKGIKALQDLYPNAKIVCIAERMKDSYKSSIESIAASLGAQFIDASIYTTSSGVHPGQEGMNEIAATVNNKLIINSGSSYSITTPESIRHYLGGVRGSILDVFGGEYEWDGYAVKLHKSRGKARDVTLRYGKNITDLRQEENIANTFTGVCPYWQSTEGQLVTLPEKVIRSANAGNFPFQRTITKDFSDKFDNAPTEAQLRAYTQSYVGSSGVGIPSISIDVSFVDLAQTEEYKDLLSLQEVELCDTIKVEFPELGVSTTEKITKTVYDVLAERYTKIGVGDVRSSLAKTIEEQIDTVSYMPTTSEVQRGIDRATGVLNQGRMGHMAINRNSEGYGNELLFLDAQSGGNLYAARNVLRINMNGIGFSSTGYQGPYYQAWTLDGILSLGGVNNAYGELQILDPQGKVLCAVTKDGYTVYADDGQTIIGQWSHAGISLKKGVIDFNWGADSIGFYADGTKVQLGDWVIDSQSYGRGIIQSVDEKTGMSADTGDEDLLYLWAGYNDSDDYVFVVNGSDAYVMYNEQAYPIGASIANLNSAVAAYIQDIESGSDDDGDEEGDGEDYGGGYLEDGKVTNDLNPDQPSDPIGFDPPS